MSDKSKGFFTNFIEGFKDSLIDNNLEADLYPVNADNSVRDKGELEYYQHTQGHTSIKIKLDPDPEIPIGEILAIYISDSHYVDITTTGQKIKLNFNSKYGDHIPAIAIGDRVEVRHKDTVLLQGQFEQD